MTVRYNPRIEGDNLRRLRLAAAAVMLTISFHAAMAQLPQPDGGTIERGTVPSRWLSEGPKCMEIPEWQVHEYNPDFFLLRQSPCTNYEKPIVFLIFGKDRALLMDTGAENGDLAPSLLRTVKMWLKRNGRTSIPLLVVHSHEHGDHVAGDAEVAAIKDPAMPVTLVKAELGPTKKLYGIVNWPEDVGHIDLGDRVIDVVPIPGHSAVSVALYDRRTAVLLSGDSMYPGRLYVADFPAFVASIDRLVKFTEGKPVAQVLGNHIEQTSTPFLDYPVGTMYQPKEHELAMSRGSLLELQAALHGMNGTPERLCLRDFSVWPVGPGFMTAAEKAAFEKHEKEEKAAMWDHTAK
jgi:hydroxyacylglutathione hydrolase